MKEENENEDEDDDNPFIPHNFDYLDVKEQSKIAENNGMNLDEFKTKFMPPKRKTKRITRRESLI